MKWKQTPEYREETDRGEWVGANEKGKGTKQRKEDTDDMDITVCRLSKGSGQREVEEAKGGNKW